MEFTRKRNARGKSQKTYREWYDETGQYRIVWRNEFMGIAVAEAYYCTVRCLISPTGLETIWNFVGKHGTYKTFNKAVESAERHKRYWEAFFKIAAGPYKGRADRIRDLYARATAGSGMDAVRIMSMIPEWVRETAEPGVLRLLNPPERRQGDEEECLPSSAETTADADLNALMEALPTSDCESSREIEEPSNSSPTTEKLGPAPVVTDGAGVTTKTDLPSISPLKAGARSRRSTAQPVMEQESEQPQPAKKPTKRRSPTGKRKQLATTTS